MDKTGYYGPFGGAFLPEILVATFEELGSAFASAKADPAFWREYQELMSTYSCRPTPLTYAENLSSHFGGARIYIKREDLNHTGAHKANNVINAPGGRPLKGLRSRDNPLLCKNPDPCRGYIPVRYSDSVFMPVLD